MSLNNPTTNLIYERMSSGTNANTWGDRANANFSRIDQSISGSLAVAVTAADVTLTVTDTGDLNADAQSRNFNLACSGALTGNRAVIVPATARYYRVSNACTGSFTLTVKTAAGTGIVVPPGQTMTLWCDATNVVTGSTMNALASVNAQTGTTYTLLSSDLGKYVTFSNASAIAVTIPQASTIFSAGFFANLMNLGAGLVTLTPTTSTIDGATSLTLPTNHSVTLFSDGTNWFTNRGARPFRGATVKLNANTTGFGSGAYGTMTWDAAVADTNSFYSGAAPTVLSIPSGVSLVRVTAQVTITCTATSAQNFIKIQKNAADLSPSVNPGGTIAGATSISILAVSYPLSVVSGDTLRVQVFQNSGAGATLAATTSFFSVEVIQ